MKKQDNRRLPRREFLSKGSGAAFGFLIGDAVVAQAEEIKPPTNASAAKRAVAAARAAPVTCAVIGLGDQGREILKTLGALASADVRYVCDSYPSIHKRALERAPKATPVEDYRKVLDDKRVQAVWVATPTHLHKDLAIAALQAGKHVYCEAPLATLVDDAKAIAAAAKRHRKQVFQTGLQRRLNPLEQHVLGFFRTGALSKLAIVQSRWNKKTSWRRAAATPQRQKALDWRLDKATSGGILAEVGIHQIDLASWFIRARPISVTGTGAVMAWKDGREVPDTVQATFEYPGGLRFLYTATLANSFEADRDVFQGWDAAIMLHKDRAWMFKESDAPNLGWEVYATKENIGDETGIALVANATKLLEEGKDPSDHRDDYSKGSLYYACEHFLNVVRGQAKPICGAPEGYEATLVALKANEAVLTGQNIVFRNDWFDLG